MPLEYDGTKEQHISLAQSHYLHGFVDGSWKIPSVAGMLVMMFGGPIDWSTKLIKVICHSSAETEVSAGSMLSKRLVNIRLLSGFLGVQIPAPIPVFIDSTAAIDITGKLGTSKRTAHFLRWQHYLRWMVQHQYVRLIFVGTKKQLADALTKSLPKPAFHKHREFLRGTAASFSAFYATAHTTPVVAYVSHVTKERGVFFSKTASRCPGG